MNFQELLQSALSSEHGFTVTSKNRIALRSLLLREIAKSENAAIRNLTVEYSPIDPQSLLILTRAKAQEYFNARPEAQ